MTDPNRRPRRLRTFRLRSSREGDTIIRAMERRAPADTAKLLGLTATQWNLLRRCHQATRKPGSDAVFLLTTRDQKAAVGLIARGFLTRHYDASAPDHFVKATSRNRFIFARVLHSID